RGGSISLLGGEIEILEGSTLSSSALGLSFEGLDPARGSAGEIRIDAARSLRIAGSSRLDTRIDAVSMMPSGSIRIHAGEVEIENSSITSEALSGDAGVVAVQSTGALTLRASSLTSSGS